MNQQALEKKKKGLGLYEAYEFSIIQDWIEDMKREQIPDFLLRERDAGSRLYKIIGKELIYGSPRIAKAQTNPDGTRKWAPYDWAYRYCYEHRSGCTGAPYSFDWYIYSKRKSPFDPVPFVKRAERNGYTYYTIRLTPEHPQEAKMIYIYMFFDRNDRYQGYVFCVEV